MIRNKIIIGSANVNKRYGLINNKININEFKKLLNFAVIKGINTVDTSPQYSNSEKVIGSLKKNFKIVTKITRIPSKIKKIEIEKWITNQFLQSCKNLRLNKVYGLLLQNAETLLSKNSKFVFRALLNLKKKNKLQKIGISVYNFKTLEKIINKYHIDFVQVPYNIFDRRIENVRLIKQIKKKGIEIHVRSIFLQGLLTKRNIRIPKKQLSLKKGLESWKKWLKLNKLTTINACLNFVLRNKNVDKIVIGFNDLKSFKQVINYKKSAINFKKLNIKIDSKHLDPRKWN
jgi:aryl-alcohol dehydrogenase-like predicted oxidoreductase